MDNEKPLRLCFFAMVVRVLGMLPSVINKTFAAQTATFAYNVHYLPTHNLYSLDPVTLGFWSIPVRL
jgi:hypothetical protein